MKVRILFLLGLCAALLTSCVPYYDYEEHTANFYVCNYTDTDLCLQVERSVEHKNKGTYESKTIKSYNQDEYLNVPAVKFNWVPGKYYVDIDGFETSNSFDISFFEYNANKKTKVLQFDNDYWDCVRERVTSCIDVYFCIYKSFIPQNASYDDLETIKEYVTDEKDEEEIENFYMTVINREESPQLKEENIRYVENLVLGDPELKKLMKVTDTNEVHYLRYCCKKVKHNNNRF